MNVYVVQGRHGELYATKAVEKALALWAETNGYNSSEEFFAEYAEGSDYVIETSENHWFLDEGGEVTLVEVR